jgi:hypothetical protein
MHLTLLDARHHVNLRKPVGHIEAAGEADHEKQGLT